MGFGFCASSFILNGQLFSRGLLLDRIVAVTVAIRAPVWRPLYNAVRIPVDRGLRDTEKLSIDFQQILDLGVV